MLPSRSSVTLPSDLRARGLHAALSRRHSGFPAPYPSTQAIREAYDLNRRRSLNSSQLYCDDLRALRGRRPTTSPVNENPNPDDTNVPPAPPVRPLSHDQNLGSAKRDPNYAGLDRNDADRYIRLYSYVVLDMDPANDSLDLHGMYSRIQTVTSHARPAVRTKTLKA